MRKLIILILFLLPVISFSEGIDIAISYTKGEKSKDSHSSTESIAIGGYKAAYSIEYSGRRGIGEQNDEKNCTLSKKKVQVIKDVIIEKGLNTNDELIDESTKYKSYELFCNISISMTIDGQDYKIKINGDIAEIGHKDLYKNAIALIDKIRE